MIPGHSKTIDEVIFELGINLSAESAQIRSQFYRNGEPMVCLQCGCQTTPDGALACDH
jgi:hypothetical protein